MSDFWTKVAITTAHLSMTEYGAYRLLLEHYLNVGGGLRATAKQLLRVCRAVAKQEQDAVDAVLHEFFEQREGVWHHVEADAQIEKRRRLSEIRAEIGRKGGSSSKSPGAEAKAKQLLSLSSSSLRKKKEPRGRRGAAAETPAPPALDTPGWEVSHPIWTRIREQFGDDLWHRSGLATCRPNGSPTVLIAASTFDRDRLTTHLGDKLERAFGATITFKVDPQQEKPQ